MKRLVIPLASTIGVILMGVVLWWEWTVRSEIALLRDSTESDGHMVFLRLVTAADSYQQQHGTWPTAVSQLTESFLLPRDQAILRTFSFRAEGAVTYLEWIVAPPVGTFRYPLLTAEERMRDPQWKSPLKVNPFEVPAPAATP